MKIADLFNVRGHSTFITGGASGLGFAIASAMLTNGANVTLVDLNADALADAKKRLEPISPNVLGIVANASDDAAMADAVRQSLDRFGRIDSAFLNAGIGGEPGYLDITGKRNPNGAIDREDDQIWFRIVEANLTSVFVGLQAVARPMREQGKGSIVITTSLAGVKNEDFVGTAYAAAKAGAAHLMRQSAHELLKFNIRVNAISPGAFATNIGNGRLLLPEINARFARTNPMGRVADPKEVAGLALLLASPAGSYMAGSQYCIDGGGSVGDAEAGA